MEADGPDKPSQTDEERNREEIREIKALSARIRARMKRQDARAARLVALLEREQAEHKRLVAMSADMDLQIRDLKKEKRELASRLAYFQERED